jgi:nitroreductase
MVLDIIKNRWSPVSFSSEPVEEFKLKAILEAARYAPSSMNEQPWLFILTTRDDPEQFQNVLDLLVEGNKVWAKNAYALIVSLARMKHVYKNRPNKYAFHDTGMAVSNMLLQATSMGVYIHQMGGFSQDRAKEYFNLDQDIEPVAIMALGYIGDGSGLPPDLLKRDIMRKTRKEISDYAFSKKINNPAF